MGFIIISPWLNWPATSRPACASGSGTMKRENEHQNSRVHAQPAFTSSGAVLRRGRHGSEGIWPEPVGSGGARPEKGVARDPQVHERDDAEQSQPPGAIQVVEPTYQQDERRHHHDEQH